VIVGPQRHLGAHIRVVRPTLVRHLQAKKAVQIEVTFQFNLNVLELDALEGGIHGVAGGQAAAIGA
jgi:hypothetical protein